jgi:lipopolysaccharide biosynthesis glycosyltransferase
MKWYFALSQATAHAYWQHVQVAVRSAQRNTTLAPHFIYDGDDDERCHWLRAEGVTIIHARVPFHDQIVAAKQRNYSSDIATGAFLRTEIPNLDQSDEVVIYTDCDVLFLGDPIYKGETIRYFAVGPETDIDDYSVNGMNTGVMFMNLSVLRRCQTSFRQFITERLESFAAFDQGAYRIYFNGLWERLTPDFNWKPYWGWNPHAKILHFHGPKYQDVKQLLAGGRSWWRYEALYFGNESAYRQYTELFESFLNLQ